MASTQLLKRRITSVKNTKQITKAMELVSASKMRRAQEFAAKSRDFRVLARALLTRLRELTDVNAHPLFVQRAVKSKVYVVITSDSGLAGAYNSNVLRQLTRALQQDEAEKTKVQLIVVGKQAARFVAKIQGTDTIAAYTNFPDQPTANDLQPILHTLTEMYEKSETDAVDIIFTDFKSSVVQEVKTERFLPAAYSDVAITPDLEAAVFEPSPKEVLNEVTARLIEADLRQIFLEAQASEHSMRMMAMKNASDNAGDIIDDLTLAFNTARQAGITQEIAEITGGAEAIK